MEPELLGYLGQVRPKSIADFKTADMWALGDFRNGITTMFVSLLT
jgi:hypothetical protein